MTLTDTKEALVVETSLPDMTLSRDLLAQAESTKIIARPVFNQNLSEFVEVGGVAHVLGDAPTRDCPGCNGR